MFSIGCLRCVPSLLLCLSAAALAAPITVINPSFEVIPPDAPTMACGTGCLFTGNNRIAPGWIIDPGPGVGTGGQAQFQPGSPAN